jgi:hypothetical protein
MNTGKKSTSWFFEDPMDFEYKKYKLLANAEAAENSLENGNIHEAMDFIEDHLVCFYRFQTDQEIRQIGDSEIVGVDPIMMDLIYKKGAKDTREDIKVLSDVAELGILEFEALHSLFRIKWRNIDDAIAISYIPKKVWPLNDGNIILVNKENDSIRRYSFISPEGVQEWKDFKMKFIEEMPFKEGRVLEICEKLGDNRVTVLATLNKSFDSVHAIDYVLACKTYYRLQKDFLF